MREAVEGAGAPVDPRRRLASIDALRGLALFGVLAINLETEFRVSIFRQFVRVVPDHGLNALVDGALDLFVHMKASALFSLLFGVGLAIQFERLGPTGRRALLLTRRLLVLLVFGLIHLVLIWNGDILTEYAVAGLVVLPFLFGPTSIIACGAVIFLSVYVLQPILPTLAAFPDKTMPSALVSRADQVYPSGSFTQVLALRITELPALLPLHTYVFPRTLGLFLLGALCWRAGLFGEIAARKKWLWLVAVLGVAGGLMLHVLKFARPHSELASPVVLALGYAALVVAVEQTSVGHRSLRWAEPLGRMAFTNYILQSAILGFIFYGYGLGLFGKLGSFAGLFLVFAVYIAQIIIISRFWLARCSYGPIEWLWRALMYAQSPKFWNESFGQRQKFTR
jgi:uncharacterized protein